MIEASKIVSIAREAGNRILSFYRQETPSVQWKQDGSPLTHADEASHHFIIQALKEISSYPIISEENPPPFSERSQWDTFWLVDPLDGTKDFLDCNGEFCINIALIEKKRPILGVLFAPALDELYYASDQGGAYFEKSGKRVRLPLISSIDPKIAVSRFHESEKTLEFISLNGFKQIKKIGSALKFGRLAQGEINIYPRFTGSSEWDIAAGDILLQEIGANITDLKTGKAPLYNTPSLRNNFFIAHAKEHAFSSFKLPLFFS